MFPTPAGDRGPGCSPSGLGCLDLDGHELSELLIDQRMRCWISCSLGEEAMPPVAGLVASERCAYA